MKMTWAVHKRIIHPVAALLRFFGLKRAAMRFHDRYLPNHRCHLWDLD